MRELTFSPAARFVGEVDIPSSKSVAHRAVICAMLAEMQTGIRSEIMPAVVSEDVEATLNVARELIECKKDGGMAMIFCGESGSTLRFFLPIAAALGIPAIFSGTGRLPNRTIAPYRQLFAAHGARLEFADEASGVFLPASLTGRLRSGIYSLRGDISSQFVTGLLFALAALNGESEIILTTPLESAPYAELTCSVMRDFGISIDKKTNGYKIRGGQTLRPRDYNIEGDWSQAAFFLCAETALRAVYPAKPNNATLLRLNYDSVQGDRAILGLLSAMKGDGHALRAIRADVSNTLDIVPPLAVVMAVAEGESEIANAGRLRIKESDRLASVAELINNIGGRARIDGDSLFITGTGGKPPRGGFVCSYNDHRIAMAAAIASLVCVGSVTVDDFSCIKKSYPAFLTDFETLTSGQSAEQIK